MLLKISKWIIYLQTSFFKEWKHSVTLEIASWNLGSLWQQGLCPFLPLAPSIGLAFGKTIE